MLSTGFALTQATVDAASLSNLRTELPLRAYVKCEWKICKKEKERAIRIENRRKKERNKITER
jgi:hypothetical protein